MIKKILALTVLLAGCTNNQYMDVVDEALQEYISLENENTLKSFSDEEYYDLVERLRSQSENQTNKKSKKSKNEKPSKLELAVERQLAPGERLYKHHCWGNDSEHCMLLIFSEANKYWTVLEKGNFKIRGNITLPFTGFDIAMRPNDKFLTLENSEPIEEGSDNTIVKECRISSEGIDLNCREVFIDRNVDLADFASVKIKDKNEWIIKDYKEHFEAQYGYIDSNGAYQIISTPKLHLKDLIFDNKILAQVFARSEVDGVTYNPGDLVTISFDTLAEYSVERIYKANGSTWFKNFRIVKDAVVGVFISEMKTNLAVIDLKTGTVDNVESDKLGHLNFKETDKDSRKFKYYFESARQSKAIYEYDIESKQRKILQDPKQQIEADIKLNWAISKDGTKVPYVMVHKSKNYMNKPTIIEVYGGYRVSRALSYKSELVEGWLKKGFNYVLAGPRGGDEMGPAWHEAARFQNKYKTLEDINAISKDLVEKKISAPSSIGLMGTSAGGLHACAAAMKEPGNYGAVFCDRAHLDMMRFNRYYGRTYVAEYGTPADPDNHKDLKAISPLHLVKEKTNYPPFFIQATSEDKIVHPSASRMLARKLKDFGLSYYYMEWPEIGHSSSRWPLEIQIKEKALKIRFFQKHLTERML